MGSRHRRRAALVLALALAVGTAAVASAAPALSPPVISESFDLLPCPGAGKEQTTLELEGCAEHEIVRTDALINARVKAIFSLLRSNAARSRFVRAQKAWLAYRRADCLSVSDVHEGGSLSVVDFGGCVVARNTQHLRELRAFEHDLRTP